MRPDCAKYVAEAVEESPHSYSYETRSDKVPLTQTYTCRFSDPPEGVL